MASIRGKVKAITAPRSRLKWPIGALVAELNPVLRGWGNYFRWGNSSRHFTRVDSYVKERLAVPWREILWALRRLEARGLIRGGRFVTGVTGEQFADETTAPLLRAQRAA